MIEQDYAGGTLVRKAILGFVDNLCQNTDTRGKSAEVTNALKDYLQENIVKPSVENACEREMDVHDQDLIQRFATATRYIQEEQKNFLQFQ